MPSTSTRNLAKQKLRLQSLAVVQTCHWAKQLIWGGSLRLGNPPTTPYNFNMEPETRSISRTDIPLRLAWFHAKKTIRFRWLLGLPVHLPRGTSESRYESKALRHSSKRHGAQRFRADLYSQKKKAARVFVFGVALKR